jgi:hypothetical protein
LRLVKPLKEMSLSWRPSLKKRLVIAIKQQRGVVLKPAISLGKSNSRVGILSIIVVSMGITLLIAQQTAGL